ncbi:DNA-3-methyladenine glycosylase [Christensenellaceae bacterium OttesenSCG-928-K19]|nr:DNA-3-methyladenine glycosylase [Christensenellaceae bacterium OttesenSCG-928-K19]
MEQQPAFFEYGSDATDYLCGKDKALAAAIEHIGPVKRVITPDLFAALVNSILSQQISTRAAETVWARLLEKCGSITPGGVLALTVEEIQSCGMSMRKAEYIYELAKKTADGTFDIQALNSMTDVEVITTLVTLKGVGVWTAEMLLIFSMQRPDVLSYDDLAIQRGLKMLYRHRDITRKLYEKYKRRYSPYASIASLYLWEIASGNYDAYPLPQRASARKRAKHKP